MSSSEHPQQQKTLAFREREALILNTVRDMALEHGLHYVTMDKVAQVIECSKGTMYQHFSSKEAVFAALAIRYKVWMCHLFATAKNFDGNSREKMCAIIEATILLQEHYPKDFALSNILFTSPFRDKLDEEVNERIEKLQNQAIAEVASIIQFAVEKGTLQVSQPEDVFELTLGGWSICIGTYILASSPCLCNSPYAFEYADSLRRNMCRYMDGVAWRPVGGKCGDPEMIAAARKVLQPELEKISSL